MLGATVEWVKCAPKDCLMASRPLITQCLALALHPSRHVRMGVAILVDALANPTRIVSIFDNCSAPDIAQAIGGKSATRRQPDLVLMQVLSPLMDTLYATFSEPSFRVQEVVPSLFTMPTVTVFRILQCLMWSKSNCLTTALVILGRNCARCLRQRRPVLKQARGHLPP